MTRHSALLNSPETQAWLSQFDPQDQPAATELLEACDFVSRDSFSERLRKLILQRLEAGPEPVGLYVERELPKRLGIPHRLFREANRKVRRADGVGPEPIQPTRRYAPSVGSEGIVAQLVSEICREFPKRCFDHPGPSKIREKHIRRFFLITDFLGTGTRARTYLRAAWRVRSVRSWWSARGSKGMSFEVVAYSATAEGRSNVEAHASTPKVSFVTACQTIRSLPLGKQQRLRTLCHTYDPLPGRMNDSLGYGGVGALIAFAHGAPNNAPRILYQLSSKWNPLFPKRITASVRGTFNEDEADPEAIAARLLDMREKRLAGAGWLAKVRPHSRAILAVLAALSRPPRDEEVVSRRTGLTILEVRRAIGVALGQDWITDSWQLTEAGQAELGSARKEKIAQFTLPEDPDEFYYPKSLRAPLGSV